MNRRALIRQLLIGLVLGTIGAVALRRMILSRAPAGPAVLLTVKPTGQPSGLFRLSLGDDTEANQQLLREALAPFFARLPSADGTNDVVLGTYSAIVANKQGRGSDIAMDDTGDYRAVAAPIGDPPVWAFELQRKYHSSWVAMASLPPGMPPEQVTQRFVEKLNEQIRQISDRLVKGPAK